MKNTKSTNDNIGECKKKKKNLIASSLLTQSKILKNLETLQLFLLSMREQLTSTRVIRKNDYVAERADGYFKMLDRHFLNKTWI